MRTSRSAALSSKDDPASGAGAGADAVFGAAPIHPHPGNAGALCRARHVLLRRNYDDQGQGQDQGQAWAKAPWRTIGQGLNFFVL